MRCGSTSTSGSFFVADNYSTSAELATNDIPAVD
jgi:hypothetical protein